MFKAFHCSSCVQCQSEQIDNLTSKSAVRSLVSTIEVVLQQPTVATKTAVQQGQPIQWSHIALYRVVGVSLASIAPVTARQFAVNGRLLRGLTASGTVLSNQDKLMCGILSGMSSAVVSTPAEPCVTRQ